MRILIVALSVVLFAGCSIKDNKICKEEMSSTIRQINSSFLNFQDNRKAEEQLNMLKMRDYYENYTKQFSVIRNDLAKIVITKKYYDYSKTIESLISESVSFFNYRQTLLSDLLEFSSSMNSLERDSENYWDYYYKRDTYDFYNEMYLETKQDIAEDFDNLEENIRTIERDIVEFNRNRQLLSELSDSINNYNASFDIIEKLSIIDVIEPEEDFLYQALDQDFSVESIESLKEMYK